MDVDRGEDDLPTLADDEARLAEIARGLLDELVAAIPGWTIRTAGERAAAAGITLGRHHRERIEQTAAELATALAEPLQRVLTADVDAAQDSPLAVLRAAAGPLNGLLDELGVAPPARDEFALAHFPEDRHAVGPAAFADVDPSLHEPGMVWGAARAHVHLRRRREAEQ